MGPTGVDDARLAWWREPTKGQWLAWVAGWLGWTLDAFDFTISLLVLVPITQEFKVPLTAAALIVMLTLWMRLLGACPTGWMADRLGRRTPLILSITWYSLCQFYIRTLVKEPEAWVECQKRQREQHREVRAPLVRIFLAPVGR
jgi:SHS family lactate transporter-like MFS transporter